MSQHLDLPSQSRSPHRPSWLAPVAILLAIFIYYLLIFLRYRPYEIDNPWFLSFSYNFSVEHIQSDRFMQIPFPGGMDGTQLFGKLAAYLQAAIVGPLGWQQRPAAVLSSLFVVLSLAMWWLQLEKLRLDRRLILCFLVIAGISEPFVATAMKFRFEFLSFAFISLGLLLVACRKPFLGVFIAALAVEVEPFAIAGLIPIFILVFSTGKFARPHFARLAAALALAAAVYLVLHPNILHPHPYLSELSAVRASPQQFDGGAFAAYFLERRRHLLELFCFLLAAAVYWLRRRSMPSHYLALSALLLTLFFIAMPHGNPAYIIFVYPFLLATTLMAFQAQRWPALILAVALLSTVPQQAYLFTLTRHLGYRSADIAAVSQAIQAAAQTLHTPDANLRIYGDYRVYFAHPHLYTSASGMTMSSVSDADLYLCFDQAPQPASLEPIYVVYCPVLRQSLPLRLVDAIPLRGSQLYLYARK